MGCLQFDEASNKYGSRASHPTDPFRDQGHTKKREGSSYQFYWN